jgi:hypothetical protein
VTFCQVLLPFNLKTFPFVNIQQLAMLQSKLNAAIGNVQHWKQEQSTLAFYTDIAIVRVRRWKLGTWQVQVSQQHEFFTLHTLLTNLLKMVVLN